MATENNIPDPVDTQEIAARADEAEAKIPGFECCDPQECYAPTIGILVADIRTLLADRAVCRDRADRAGRLVALDE